MRIQTDAMEAAWRALSERVMAYAAAEVSAGRPRPDFADFDITQPTPWTARITVRLSNGHAMHGDVDLLQTMLSTIRADASPISRPVGARGVGRPVTRG